jgi:hypothetical protein
MEGRKMKKALVTQAFGDEWKKILDLTRPRMEAYCQRHQIDFIALEKPLTDPVQYSKSAIGNIMATKGYDQVTFVDSDVLITKDCPDIGEDAGVFCAFDEGAFLDRKLAMGKLAGAFGAIIDPRFYVNTGVFVISSKAVGALSMPPLGLLPNHFAEQTWMNIMVHIWNIPLTELDPVYNCMTSVEEHFGLDRYTDGMCIHYAGQSNNMTNLTNMIKSDDEKLVELGR